MSARSRIRHAVVKLGKASPTVVRRPLARAARPLRSHLRGPVVTIAIAVSDDETSRIGPCLDSVRNQSYPNLDIRVVPYGRAARVLAIAKEHAAADWRIRVAAPVADRAAAWNQVLVRSRRPYLLFLAGGDDLVVTGVQALVSSLEASGSQVAIGQTQRPPSLHTIVESPYQAAHEVVQIATTLRDAPVAVTDLNLSNRVFRASFLRRAGLRFDPADRRGTRLVLDAYAGSDSFDLLVDRTYISTGRREGVSVGAVDDVLSQLEYWLAEHEMTRVAIETLGSQEVMDWWLWGVLDSAIQPFLGDVERATAAQWSMLRDHVDRLIVSGGESAWRRLRAESRVKLWLVQHDHRAELESYIIDRMFERSNRRTRVEDGVVLAELPYFRDPEVGIPDSAFVMREVETPLWAQLGGVRWSGPRVLTLDLFARIDRVGMTEDPEISAALVEAATGQRLDLEVDQRRDERANMAHPSRYQDYSRGVARAVVDVTELARRGAELTNGRWQLELSIRSEGISRTGRVRSYDERGTVGLIGAGHLATRLVDGVRIGLQRASASQFAIVTEVREERVAGAGTGSDVEQESAARLTQLRARGFRVEGALRLPTTTVLPEVRLVPDAGRPVVCRVAAGTEPGELTFNADLRPRRADQDFGHWRLVVGRGREEASVWWPEQQVAQWLATPGEAIHAARSIPGHVEIARAVATLVIESATLLDGTIECAARWLGSAPAGARVTLQSPRGAVPCEVVSDGDVVRLRCATAWDEWGLGTTPLPTGRYRFVLTHEASGQTRGGRVLLGDEALAHLLEFQVGSQFRFRLLRAGGREAGVYLDTPMPDPDRSPYGRARLQQWFHDCDLPLDDNAVYFQSYTGASATDSQLALHEELRRTRPDLTLYWGIREASSTVPEGGVPVLMHSREWFEVMATARRICMNIDPDRWFSLRPGQQLLQTFHGYPAKSMGIRMWEAKGYTPRRVDLELARTSGSWTLILTPSPEMDQYYRREYRYDGPIHSSGYPRDDMLLASDAARLRRETRERLGITPDQRVVLYAPTWRDDLATNWRRAELTSFLDLETASRRLGPEYVFLMRGHRFHSSAPAAAEGGARQIDVTNYPEINHLILASDAAVLDYSSLRFDFALTGRPMIFLVPDLDTYTGGVRGFLYPFEDSAPGPLAQTADEVIGWLRDLGRLEREFAAAREKFHRTYNYLQDGHAAARVAEAFFD